jgi:alpha-beta hydrolase superfamily lysophospholipase
MLEHAEATFTGAAGHTIFYQTWLPSQPPRALILVVHGAAEHGGRYQRFAEHFVERGYALAALDHIGHGQSTGTPGFVERFSDYVDTLDIFQQKLAGDFPGIPQVLLGHSMGGLISANYLLRNQQAFVACVLSGPAIKTDLEPPFWQLWLIRLFSRITPKMGALQLDASGVSRDPAEVEIYRKDPLVYTGKLSARMVLELFGAMATVQERAAEISLPILMMHGGADALASPEGSRFLDEAISSTDKRLEIYPDLYHEIFNEPERLEVFEDLENWLSARLGPRAE